MTPSSEALARAANDPAWAWARYEPGAERPWDARLAAHLLRRAGFGPNRSEIDQAAGDGPQKTIDRLLQPDGDPAEFEEMFAEYERAAEGSVESLRAWWLRRMIQTPYPLLEKLTLFWHGHFAVSQAEVGRAPMLQRHVQLLREQALGDFRSLLKAVMLDPATLVCLKAEKSRKATPPTALARTLLARFTVGEGNFSESDVTETARAFTGWFVNRNSREFYPREFDDGEKTVFGKKGNFTAEEVLDVIADQRATSQTIVRKLYRQFVSEVDEPGDALLDTLVDSFAKTGNVLGTIETVLRSNLFFSPAAYRCRVKSPVEYAVGLVRAFEGRVATDRLGRALADLGQGLYNPPTSAGWPDGLAWLNDATVVGRHNLAWQLLQQPGDNKYRLDAATYARQHGKQDAVAARELFLDLLLQSDAPDAAAVSAAGIEDAARLVACLPEYQPA
ncbi:MAG: DUF1800 domain-containing protein [Planctomycetaceae bacterium]|nr:DUF1800 domain-containing protein [Planctomycetaceae bacterium]